MRRLLNIVLWGAVLALVPLAASAQEIVEVIEGWGLGLGAGLAVGAGFAVGLAGLGCGIGQGLTAGNTSMFTNFILAMVLIESIAIYGLVIALLLVFRIPGG
jgi:F0F1-type ATP synthase membrane subunit c/vacuolar-type H+-ATPase subunit K